ncbi:MAG: prepilin peptidase [Candidatus Micrarchaeia archaeon]|jgi:Flp pilus assembly protein protease CpaA
MPILFGFSFAASFWAILAALFFCLAASIFDLKTGKVPNSLNYAGFAAALAAAFSGGLPSALLAQYAILLFFSFCFAFALFRIGAWGGGDAKFFTALAAWLPFVAPDGAGNPFVFLEIFLASAVFLLLHRLFSGGLRARGFLPSACAAMAFAGVEDFKTKRRLIALRGKSAALAPFLSAGFLAVAALAGAGFL